MKGKILGAGVIRGKDDKRYTFDTNELQNAQGRDIDELVGSEVDFEVADGEAVSIYITEFKSILPNANTNSNFNQSENFQTRQNFNENSRSNANFHTNSQNYIQNTFAKAIQKPISPQMQEIKNKAFGSIALKILGAFILAFSNVFADFDLGLALYFIGLGVMFVGFLVLCATINLVQRYSNSDTLLKNLIIAEIVGLIVGVAVFLFKTMQWHDVSQESRIAFLITYIVALILLIFYNYRYFKELAQSTQQPLFLYAFWCGVTLILSPVALVFYVVAWVKFREIKDYDENKPKPKTRDDKAVSLKKIKTMAYVACVCALIPIVNLLSFVLYILIYINLKKVSQSTTLLKNFVLSIVIAGIGIFAATICNPVPGLGSGDTVANAVLIVGIVILGIFFALLGWIAYRFYKELSYITNNKLFFYLFVCRILTSAPLTLYYYITMDISFVNIVGIVINVVNVAVELVAWVRTKEIRKSYTAVG